MNQRINSHNKPEKKRDIFQNKTIKYITVQRIKSKNRNLSIFSDKDKEEKSRLYFSEAIKNTNGNISDKRKTASHSNMSNINKEKKIITKPFLYSINNSYRSKKLKKTNSNSYLIGGGGRPGAKGANKSKIKPKIKFNKISNTLSSHEIKGNKSNKKFNTIIHCNNNNNILSNIHVINHIKKRCIYDKNRDFKEYEENRQDKEIPENKEIKEDKENKDNQDNKENKENINSNPNPRTSTNTYNTISINHDFSSFIIKKNKKFNGAHTHRNKVKCKNINTNINAMMSKTKNLEPHKDIIYDNNKNNNNNSINDTTNTIIIKKNNSALLTFGNANNDSLSESLSKGSNSNNKYLLILKQENENLKNELKKTKEKVDVLEYKIENLICGKNKESVSTLILNSRNDISAIKCEHRLVKEKYNTISNKPKLNDKNRLKMKNNKFMKSYKSLGNLKYIENKNKSVIKESREFKDNKENKEFKVKDNNLYYKSPTERNSLMGRTISNGFGMKKINNELYIYNKKI